MAKLQHAPILVTNDVSPLSSVRSNGWRFPLATNAISMHRQIRRRRSSLRIVNESESAPLKEEVAKAVPAGVVLGRSSFPPGFAFGTATSNRSCPCNCLVHPFAGWIK